jgi:hypothetical protein
LTLGISYDRSTGRDTFFVDDNTAMVALSYHGYAPGTGQNYRQARVGAEFAADPWSTFTYTAPAAETHLVTFRNNFLVTYSGHHSGFSSWWTHHKILATSNGTSAGIIEVRPHNVFKLGANFGVYFEH